MSVFFILQYNVEQTGLSFIVFNLSAHMGHLIYPSIVTDLGCLFSKVLAESSNHLLASTMNKQHTLNPIR